MKLERMVNRLAEIGLDKKSLRKLSHKELEGKMETHANALATVAKAKAERDAELLRKAQLRALRQQREEAERRQEFEAEQFRLRCIRKPLPRIGPTPEQAKRIQLRNQIQSLEVASKEAAHKFRETGDRSWAEKSANFLRGARNLQEAARQDGVLV
jgi:hypothetical protein